MRLYRNFPSRIANMLISRMSGVVLHDYGCTLKAVQVDPSARIPALRRDASLYPYLRGMARRKGHEIPVRHHARSSGVSKYGLERTFKVILDLLLVNFLTRCETKPIYVFGGAAL